MYVVYYFLKNRKDGRMKQEEQITNRPNTSSKKPKQSRKCSHVKDKQQNVKWYGPENLRQRMSENVQNMRQS